MNALLPDGTAVEHLLTFENVVQDAFTIAYDKGKVEEAHQRCGNRFHVLLENNYVCRL